MKEEKKIADCWDCKFAKFNKDTKTLVCDKKKVVSSTYCDSFESEPDYHYEGSD